MPKIPRRTVLADDVYEAIKGLIMDHAIRPGARISIDGLAGELEVSQTPVREALARLESEELVVKQPLKGYRATELLTMEEFDDLHEFRRIIEPWAARRVAERIAEGDIDATGQSRLRREIAEASVPSTDDYEGYRQLFAHDQRFHLLITELCGNTQLHRAFERTHCHLHVFRLHFNKSIGPNTVAEHLQIADSVLAGDADRAHAAMLAHVDNAMGDRLRRVYTDQHS